MFKGEDSLSYLMLDAFSEVMQNHKCEYTFHDHSKTLFYQMANVQLTIFNFNFLGYEDNITEDCNAFEDSSPDINAEKDIHSEDFANGNTNKIFWEYLSFITFWLVVRHSPWWIFVWTFFPFNLLLGLNYLFWFIYVFLIKFFPKFIFKRRIIIKV